MCSAWQKSSWRGMSDLFPLPTWQTIVVNHDASDVREEHVPAHRRQSMAAVDRIDPRSTPSDSIASDSAGARARSLRAHAAVSLQQESLPVARNAGEVLSAACRLQASA
jgi:hypothetical protein